MSNRVLVISWDGATFDILDPLISQGHLPYLAQRINNGAKRRLRSCIPPVSAAAWASFQTGKNPGKHGVFDFLSYEPGKYEPALVNSASVHSETLWELLSQAGKRCIVINVPVTYPPKPINGWLVSGMLTPGLDSQFTFPRELKDEILQHVDYEIFVYPRTYWQKGPLEFVRDLIRVEKTHLATALHLAEQRDWDFLMVHVQSTDTLQHMLWDRLHSLSRAAHPQDELDRLVLEFFTMLDQGIHQLGQMLDSEDHLILLSDHGFGSVSHSFHINDWLMREGFLTPRIVGTRLRAFRRAKQALKKMDVLNLRLRSGLLHRNSPLQRFKRLEQASVFDWTRTKAFALMGSSCAGVYVNLTGREQNGVVPRDQYEQVRQALIDRVQDIDALEGVRAYRREDLYSGSSLDSMPDVVVIPGDGYHITTALSDSGDFLSPCTDQTGEHRMEGILVIQSKSVEQRSEQSAVDQATIFDIAPTVLRLFGLPVPADMDGKVLINKTDWAPPVAALAPETIAHTELSNQSESYSSEDEEAIRQWLADLGYMD